MTQIATGTNPTVNEPFGQQGVLRRVPRILALASMVLCLLSCVMWYRSQTVADVLSRPAENAMTTIRSSYGRILIVHGFDKTKPVGMTTGWRRDRSDLQPLLRDPWQSSFWKNYVGAEMRFETLFNRQNWDGFWVRIRWSTIAVLFLIFPSIYVVASRIRMRQPPVLVQHRYCPKCGNAVASGVLKCPDCGRNLTV
jgi:hypothetical protein